MTATRIGINGFGRMGRLALRAAWGWPELEFVHVNELKGDAATGAHLLEFDSVHGRWPHDIGAHGGTLVVDGDAITYPTRDTLGAIEQAGFVVERCDRFSFSPSAMVPTIPHILGVARKP